MPYTFDYHVHTGRSFCGENDVTVEALVALMAGRGLDRFSVTDHSSHFYFDNTVSAWNPDIVLDPAQIAKHEEKAYRAIQDHLAMIRSFAEKGVLTGLEIDITFRGDLVIPYGIMDNLDIVIGAAHWLPGLSIENTPPLKQLVRDFLDLNSLLMEQDIDVLAHPTRVFKKNGLHVPSEVVDPLIDIAIANNVALEINSHSEDPDEFFVKRCLEKGATLALGTDSHSLKEFGDFSYHRAMLTKCGVREDDKKSFLFEPGSQLRLSKDIV